MLLLLLLLNNKVTIFSENKKNSSQDKRLKLDAGQITLLHNPRLFFVKNILAVNNKT